MEPKLESLRWTTTCGKSESRRSWVVPFVEGFDLLGFTFRRHGRGDLGREKTQRKGKWVERWIHLQVEDPVAGEKGRKSRESCVHVCPFYWERQLEMVADGDSESETVGIKGYVDDFFQRKMKDGERWVAFRKRMGRAAKVNWNKMKLPFVTDLDVAKVWKAMKWVERNGEVRVLAALHSVVGVEVGGLRTDGLQKQRKWLKEGRGSLWWRGPWKPKGMERKKGSSTTSTVGLRW